MPWEVALAVEDGDPPRVVELEEREEAVAEFVQRHWKLIQEFKSTPATQKRWRAELKKRLMRRLIEAGITSPEVRRTRGWRTHG